MIEINKEKLGAIYSKDSTTFRVFAPERKNIDLFLTDDYRKVRKKKIHMKKLDSGIFETTVNGDYDNYFYSYLVENKWEVTDPYCKACSINSIMSAVVDLKSTDPKGFRQSKRAINKEEDAVIYELNVKDFTAFKSSKVKHRGKYLGLAEKNTNNNGIKTSLSHLKELGVTHVQILPIYDFITTDERTSKFFNDDNYNWGYDPELYFVPEGSYSSNPEDPKTRIIEIKEMIKAIHDSGMNVIMDVVFNHTFKLKDSNFEILAPKYYHRVDENGNFANGSGVGNEFSSESEMGRKLIVECIKFWAKEYMIDGFRFDLMALIDLDTVEIIIKELKKINPNIIIYGEPWMAFESPLPKEKQVLPFNQQGKNFAIFNGEFRDAIKGDNDGYRKGYIQGNYKLKQKVESGIAGSIEYDKDRMGFCKDANETINYFNCHDNLILNDKLLISLDDEREIKDITKLAMGIIMFSFGKPFLYEGNEFMNTKNKVSNSYNSPLSINAIDWNLKEKNYDLFVYTKELIATRKKLSVFKMTDAYKIKENLKFLSFLDDSMIGYTIKSDLKVYLIIINASRDDKALNLLQLKIHLGYNEINIKQIFSKSGVEERNLYDADILIDKLSVNVYEIGVGNGL